MKRFCFVFLLLYVGLTRIFAQEDYYSMLVNNVYISAMECKLKGDYETELTYLRTCAKVEPNNPTLQYDIAFALLQLDQLDYAAQFADKAARLDSAQHIEFIEFAIQCNKMVKNYDVVDYHYNKLFAIQPDNVEYLFDYADFLNNDKSKHQQAIDILMRINNKENLPSVDFHKNLRLQYTYMKLGNKRKAKKILDKLEKQYPDNSTVLYNLYFYYLADLKPGKSQSYLEKAAMAEGGEIYLFDLAELYLRLGMDSLFHDTFVQAIANPDVDGQEKINKIYSFIFAKNPTFNQKTVNRCLKESLPIAIKTHPSTPAFPLFYSIFSEEILSDKTKALKVLEDFLVNNEGSAAIWQRILSLKNFDDNQDYIDYTGRAMNDLPGDVPFAIMHASAYRSANNYVESIKVVEENVLPYLQSAAKNNQNDSYMVIALDLLGANYFYIDSISKSYQVYEEALKIDPENPTLLNNYAYYLALKDGDLDKAEKMISTCTRIVPTNVSYLDTYAYVLYKKGRYKEASFVMSRCIDLPGSFSDEVYDHYGDILIKLDKTDDAIHYWREALKIATQNKEQIEKKIQDAQNRR